MSGNEIFHQVELCGRAKLLSARYTFDSSKFETVCHALTEANRLEAAKEDVHYHMAVYYDKFIGKNYKESDLDTQGEIPFHVVRSFGLSLVYGCRNIHQSLPRMISLWLDYGARVASVKEADRKKEMKVSLSKMNELVLKCAKAWPLYYFLTVFPLLSSRICHPQDDVWQVLRSILVEVFACYPNQVFWQLVAILKSSFKTRSGRCEEVFRLARQKRPELAAFQEDGRKLADALQTLADLPADGGKGSLDALMPGMCSFVLIGQVHLSSCYQSQLH